MGVRGVFFNFDRDLRPPASLDAHFLQSIGAHLCGAISRQNRNKLFSRHEHFTVADQLLNRSMAQVSSAQLYWVMYSP